MPVTSILRLHPRRTRVSVIVLVLAAGLTHACAALAQPGRAGGPPDRGEPDRAGHGRIVAPAGPLDRALLSVAAQTGQQLLYTPDLVAGRRTAGLSGRFAPDEALARLVAEHGLVVVRVGSDAVALKRRPGAAAGPRAFPGDGRRPFADDAPVPTAKAASAQPPPPPAEPTVVEELRVTGSHIRGVAPGASPLVVIGQEELVRSGRATVAEALQALPQNYAGEGAEGLVNTRADRVGTNTTFASAVNLRGLGSDATLVLVNGRRVAGSGARGDFTDVSGLPNAAIERVEVLLDGASAAYGSDAVGGVVNIILRQDYHGLQLRLRGGTTTRAGPTEAQLGLLAGKSWADGGVMLSYEAYRRGRLEAADRAFARSADLRPLGGSDRRETLAFPGNILRADPATGALTPYYGVPAGQDGVGLSPADFQPGVVNRHNQNVGLDLLPAQTRQSLYAAFNQDLTPRVTLTADLRYALREAKADITIPSATLLVNAGNPFFVSPVGAASHQIQYSFAGLLRNPEAEASARTLTGSLGARAELGSTWALDGYLAYARSTDRQRLSGLLNSVILNEALGASADNPATGFDASRDGHLNPFSGLPGGPAAVASAIGSGFSRNIVRNEVYTASLQADGVVLRLPGGEMKAALGVQARRETFENTGENFTGTATPTAQLGLSGDRTVAAAFAEARVPLFGPENALPGLRSLELTGAARYERYSDFGDTLNPKVGLIWSPASGLRVRATYSESYRAPALTELHDRELYTPIRRNLAGARLLTLTLNGGNPDLGPETAKTYTVGFDLQPRMLGGLQLSATWFRTAFDNRIDRPVLSNSSGVLGDPRLAQFVRRVSPATNPADLALLQGLISSPAMLTSLGVFPATEYGAIVDARYINTSSVEVEGLDLSGRYTMEAFGGQLTLSANATRLFDYVQQLTRSSAPVELAGVLGYPPRTRARLGVDWARGVFGGGLVLNHQSGARDAAGIRIDGLQTVDLNLRFTGGPGGALNETELVLTVRNLFDEDPPFYDNPTGFGFDPATGDPIGRFVALQLTRSW